MPMRSPPLLSRSLAALALVAAAGCATPPPNGGAASAGWAVDDQVAAMRAAGIAQYEVEAARLGLARAASPQVRNLAQQLLAHHVAAQERLAALLRARGLEPPAQLPPQYALRLAELAAPQDAQAFERRFVRAGVGDHLALVSLHEQAVRRAVDPALRAWFAGELPALREHVRQAHALAPVP